MRYEQLVYGSFPFWDRGYAVLAHSPGCLPGWIQAFQAACQKFGERPRGASEPFPGAMFTVRDLAGAKVWAVVGVTTPGADDHGRPDALAFHGLIVRDREFRSVGYDPFALASCLRTDWNAGTSTLERGECEPAPPAQEASPEALRIAAPLKRGRRVAIESGVPIDELARSVWAALPASCRKRLSVATWAYCNDLRFDLLAAPRLASLALDASYVDPSVRLPAAPSPWARTKPYLLVAASVALAGVSIATVRGLMGEDEDPIPPLALAEPDPPPVRVKATEPSAIAPARGAYRGPIEDPAEARAVEQGLASLGSRLLDLDPDAARGPTAWMLAIAAFRYEGRWLTDEELAAISASTALGRSRALADHARVRLFAADRPLPEGFASGPLRWQLDTLAWSFHLELAPKLTAEEVPSALAEALSLDEPVSPNPLEAAYPALADYARFLGRLPQRP